MTLPPVFGVLPPAFGFVVSEVRWECTPERGQELYGVLGKHLSDELPYDSHDESGRPVLGPT